MTKFCKDCKWLMPDGDGNLNYARCGHKKARKNDPEYLVWGGKQKHYFCTSERTRGCGPEGKNWESK